MIRPEWRGKRPVENQHFSISTETLNFRPSDLARRPVTEQAFLRAPETSITELNPPGGNGFSLTVNIAAQQRRRHDEQTTGLIPE